jgi:hypothetical protein
MTIVFYYLPAEETKAPTAQSKTATVTSKPAPKPSADKLQSCGQGRARRITDHGTRDTLKLSDFEPTWRALKELKDRLLR